MRHNIKSFKANLFKSGAPRYVRCYDNGGKSIDRYTAVFTGRYRQKTGDAWWYVAMNAAPPSARLRPARRVRWRAADRPPHQLASRKAYRVCQSTGRLPALGANGLLRPVGYELSSLK